MKVTLENVAAANKASVDAASAVSSLGLQTVERLVALNLNTVRAAMTDATANANAVLAVKEPKELASLLSAQAEPALAAATDYFRSAYGILVDSGEEYGKLVDAQLAELNKNVAVTLDELSKSAPAGSDVAVAAVKQAIAAANATYDNVSKATKKVVEITEANVASATAAVVKAPAKTSRAKKAA